MKITQAIFSGSSQSIDDKLKTNGYEFAFIGRSNVGKSSLINMICDKGALAKTSSTPGKTLLINRFLINNEWYLVDLPGYGFAKISKTAQEKILKMVLDYIGKSEKLAILFVLLDSRHDIQKIDLEFLLALQKAEVPFAIVFTKCDKLGRNSLEKQITKNKTELKKYWEQLPPIFISSAEKKIGREELLDYIDIILKNI